MVKNNSVTALRNEITRTKKRLINRAKKYGIYENFGQDEVRRLEDKYIDISNYSKNEMTKRMLIDQFDEWCSTFSYSDLKYY